MANADSLDELTDDLNAALALAAQRFQALDLKVAASVPIAGGKLHWKRHDKTWGFFYEGVETTPLVSASRKIRIEAAGALKELHQALLDERSAQIAAAKVAIESIDSFLNALDDATPEK